MLLKQHVGPREIAETITYYSILTYNSEFLKISFLKLWYITVQINYLKNDVAKGINRNQLLNSILRVKEEKIH